MKKGNLIILVFILLILIISLISIFILGSDGTPSTVATITVYGKVEKTIDLNDVKEPYDFEVTNGTGGYNIIHVEPGKICISDANCPDHVCVKKGYVTSKIAPAVCIPNGVMVEVDDPVEPEIDSISQ